MWCRILDLVDILAGAMARNTAVVPVLVEVQIP